MKPYADNASKKNQVRRMFDTIAPVYDRLNHLLSLGLDRGWRRRTVRRLAAGDPHRVLDLATGTGDLALSIARRLPQAEVCGADLSPRMIAQAGRKAAECGFASRVAFSVADAERLDWPDGAFDAVTVAFGVRNFQDIPQGLAEAYRVLVPGGRLMVLEFSTPRGKLFGPVYRFYFHRVLPRVGGWLSHDRDAYRYLPASVDEFPAPEAFAGMLAGAGFRTVEAERLCGGVAYLYIAGK